MATFTVTNLNDSGAGSLRDTLRIANEAAGADSVVFSSALKNRTLVLATQLTLESDVTIDGDIDGDGRGDITISGNDTTRIMYQGDAKVTLEHLALTRGNSTASGGAIYASTDSRGLTLSGVSITNSRSSYAGGGLSQTEGTVTIINSTFSGNSSNRGGAIDLIQGNLILVGTTLSGNSATLGGGIAISGGLTLANSTIVDNRATTGGGLVVRNTSSAANIDDSVIAGNVDDGASAADDVSGQLGIVGFSFFGTQVAIRVDTGGNIVGGGDARLGELLDNGGPVLTHSPLDGSPLIDKGSTGRALTDFIDLDGDGNSAERTPIDAAGRPREGDGHADIGAVERIVNETIKGTAAVNRIFGGVGNDTLQNVGAGDRLDGGKGNDTYLVDRFRATVVEFAGGGTDTVKFTGIAGQTYALTAFVDKLQLGGGAATNGKGNGLNNSLTGNSGNNTLDGDAGNDTLIGDRGNDVLRGGLGRDIMTGGIGRDRFDFDAAGESGKTGGTRDVIKDFARGQDKIDLSTIDANGSVTGNGRFSLLATEGASFTGVRGQLIFDQVNPPGAANDRTVVLGDVNGDGRADFAIELSGIKPLTASDFIL